MWNVFVRLLVAHLLGDFLCQRDKWVADKAGTDRKKKFIALFKHSLVHAALAYVLVGDWNNAWLPMAVFFIHGLIDWISAYWRGTWRFVCDQILHLLSLLVLATLFYGEWSDLWQAWLKIWQNEKLWWILAAYLTVLHPTGYFIKYFMENWQWELTHLKTLQYNERESLKKAGMYIGFLERILTLTFVLTGQYTAIGFLIAAKSVFRFGDLTGTGQRKRTEYILIGTLMSMAVAIGVGILINHFIHIHN